MLKSDKSTECKDLSMKHIAIQADEDTNESQFKQFKEVQKPKETIEVK